MSPKKHEARVVIKEVDDHTSEVTVVDPRNGRQAGPTRTFRKEDLPREVEKVKQLFERAGNLVTVAEPGR